MYLSASTIQKRYEISRSTLTNWAERGHIRFRRLNGHKRIYHIRDIELKLGCTEAETTENCNKKKIIYCRVSSTKQKEDLRRQVSALKAKYPDHLIYKDIGSGLNYNRPRFKAVLDGIFRESISEVVISYRDRLCRYGFELVDLLCKQHGTKIVVENNPQGEPGNREELAEDLLAVCNFFVARNNGRRSHKIKKNQVESQQVVEEDVTQVDGDIEMDLQSVSGQDQQQEVQEFQKGSEESGHWSTQPWSSQEEVGEKEEEERKKKRKLEQEIISESSSK